MNDDEPIGWSKVALITGLGVCVDGAQGLAGALILIPLFGLVLAPMMIYVVGFIGYIGLYIVYKVHGATLASSFDRIMLQLVTVMVEFTPVMGVLPAWTVNAFFTAVSIRYHQQKEYNEKRLRGELAEEAYA